jgi:putative endonuclease
MCRRFKPGSHHRTPAAMLGFFVLSIYQSFSMFSVYILYSASSGKTYVGFTNDIDRRMLEHNFTEVKGYTLKFRPWTLIFTEEFEEKKDAMKREKYFKTGVGREEIKIIVKGFLQNP